MRIIRSLVAVGALAATATAVAVAPAMADPVNKDFKPVTPQPYDVVGVGAGTTEYLFDQFSYNYNETVASKKADSPSNPYFYSWDATPANNPLDETQQIVLKTGCAKVTRPDGGNAGIKALDSVGTTSYKGKSYPCANFARAAQPRTSSDPSLGPGGVAFVALAGDAVTYATTSNSYAPNNLNLKQLQEIFSCSVPAANGDPAGSWGALLGSKAKAGSAKQIIDPIVPQAGAGTLTFWMETALGFSTDSQPTCSSQYKNSQTDPTAVPQENEGVDKAFLLSNGKPNPNVLFPFSIGFWVAQQYHSRVCGKAAKKGQNTFGCDENGILLLNGISGTPPTITNKTTGVVSLNPDFDTTFQRTLYDVVPYNTVKSPIPAQLAKFFGPTGVFCTKTYAPVIEDYGFLPISTCGKVS